ncbi:minor capsid protein [Pseudomonas quasicaspiana]|uniref:minor capsid protein n=1 Tax=Pseudomonas quasicaspiana TaxID=2829821 RepID=UPI001E62B4D8|nr:minor capsid protein [Pseudomonas quasicaspiana]MCD5970764.1 minor capsid protein [Pseudomonas quasicaspiana]
MQKIPSQPLETQQAEPSTTALLDQTIRNAVMVERLKAEEVQKFEKYLRLIDRLVREQLTRKELTTYSRERLEDFLSRVDEKLLAIYAEYSALVQADLVDIALYEAAFEARSLNAAFPGLGTVVPTNAVIRSSLSLTPLQVSGINGGKLLKTFFKGWTRTETSRVTNAIRVGFTQGQTNAQIVQAIRGTAAQNFTDGVLAVSERNARTIVNTAVQHAASTARMETAKANPDVISEVEMVSTLDRKTTPICRYMDKKRFPTNSGPRPPFHENCRTTFVFITRLSEMFEKGATRAAVGADGGGQVDASLQYYSWLQTQPASFQDTALGPVRGKLFRDGGLSPDKFAKLQLDKNFKPITLKQMQKLEPDMFKRAGVQ